MIQRFILLTGLLATLPTHSDAQQTHIDTVVVGPYLQLSHGAFARHLRLKTNRPYIDHIEGFEFQWGTTAVVKVKVEYLAHPPADASRYRVTLMKVLKRENEDDNNTFSLRLESQLYLGPGEQHTTFVRLDEHRYRYFDLVTVEVPEHLLHEFEQVVEGGLGRNGIFTFADANGTIALKGWE